MTPLEKSVALCICGNPACDIPFGLCHCRCGEKTLIAKRTFTCNGVFKGLPLRYLNGHYSSPRTVVSQEVLRDGEVLYRMIALTKDQVARVSPHRYNWLVSSKWCALWNDRLHGFYAVRTATIDGRPRTIYMHRQILGLDPGDPLTGDHIKTEETLNNTDENLRVATRGQQQYNQRKGAANSSGYKGVSFYRPTGKWMAQIKVDKIHIFLGYYSTPEEAYAIYCAAALKYHGAFARLE